MNTTEKQLDLNRADIGIQRTDLDRAIAKRDKLILAARAEGLSLRTIADAAGISHTAVAKILERNH